MQYSHNLNQKSFSQTVSEIWKKYQLPTNSLDWKADRMPADAERVIARKKLKAMEKLDHEMFRGDEDEPPEPVDLDAEGLP
jgi:hypothetical protein